MAIDTFIPTLWSSELIVSLKKVLVFGQEGIINKNYEGEIASMGDTVKITSLGKVTVSDYVKNTDMAAAQELQDAESFLLIDRQKYFNFQVDDVDAVQQKPKVMGQAMVEAAYALANEADQYIATRMSVDTPSGQALGTVGSPKTISAATDAYNFIVDAAVYLDQNNVPKEGRFVIVPAWYYSQLLKDDRFVKAPNPSPMTNVIENGVVKRLIGIDVLVSNNVINTGTGIGTTGDKYTVQLGHGMATTYADQIAQVEAYRPHLRFADAVKGLHVYGSKVIRPEGLATIVVQRP